MARKSGAIRTGVVGLGRAGWDIHVRALRGRQDFVITDAVDLQRARREEAKAEFGCQTYRDFREFLRKSDAELAVIATPSSDHTWMTIEALRAGMHVLVEKPMSTSVRDADRMIAQAKKSKRLLTIHQNARLAPDFCHVRQVIESGVLGHVFLVRRAGYGFHRRRDWQTLSKYGGGQLNNTAVHMVDQVCQLLDSPVKDVFGDLQQLINPGDVEDYVRLVVRAESGMVGEVESTMVCALPLPAWVVMGSRGTLVSDGQTSRLRYHKAKKLPVVKPIDKLAVEGRKYGFGEVIEFVEESMPSSLPPKRNYYDHLYDSLRKGKPLFVDPQEVRQVMYVIQEAKRGTPFR
jgi:predicted dehydrogenase